MPGYCLTMTESCLLRFFFLTGNLDSEPSIFFINAIFLRLHHFSDINFLCRYNLFKYCFEMSALYIYTFESLYSGVKT